MATLYFNGAVDNDWDEIGNWWTNSAGTSAAAALPSSSDSVVITAAIYSNSGDEPTVVNIYATANMDIAITVTGVATFDTGGEYGGNISGAVVFDGTSKVSGSGLASFSRITSMTFNDYSSAPYLGFPSTAIPCVFNDFSACDSSSDFSWNGNGQVVTFRDMSVLGSDVYRRDEAGQGFPTTNSNSTHQLIFEDDALYFGIGVATGPKFEFRDNAYNATGTSTYPDTNIIHKPSRGINGSSILGVV
jgi:hypothetical protein